MLACARDDSCVSHGWLPTNRLLPTKTDSRNVVFIAGADYMAYVLVTRIPGPLAAQVVNFGCVVTLGSGLLGDWNPSECERDRGGGQREQHRGERERGGPGAQQLAAGPA